MLRGRAGRECECEYDDGEGWRQGAEQKADGRKEACGNRRRTREIGLETGRDGEKEGMLYMDANLSQIVGVNIGP